MNDNIEDYVGELIYEEGVLLECKNCQNKKRFHYRETVGCTIIVDDEVSQTNERWYPFKDIVIECVDCGHILWREGG